MVSRGRQAASDLFNAIVNKVREIPSQMLSIGSNIVSGKTNLRITYDGVIEAACVTHKVSEGFAKADKK